jgi:hypothetical protein
MQFYEALLATAAIHSKVAPRGMGGINVYNADMAMY